MVTAHYDVPEVYEPEVVGVIEKFVRAGDVVVDAGASVGFFSCLMSKIVGGNGRVLAFEPNLESFRHLERNINKRGLSNVMPLRMALWSCDMPEIELWSIEEIGYTSICHYHSAIGSEIVEARSLDSLLPTEIRPRFMKIDCEMAEFEILRGAERILRDGVDCVVLEFNYNLMVQNNISDHAIRGYMADLGYEMFLIGMPGNGDTFHAPIRVMPDVEIEFRGSGAAYINAMFTTEDKVRSRWTT